MHFLFFIIAIQTSSFAQSCPEMDLRNPALGPPRDQSHSQWCFAYVSADILSHELNQRISASDIAINYLASFKGVGMEFTRMLSKTPDTAAGTEKGAIKKLRTSGFCLEINMPSNKEAFQEYLLLRGLDSTREPFAEEYKRRCSVESLRCEFHSSLFPRHNFCDLLSVAGEINTFSNRQFANIRDFNCQQRVRLPDTSRLKKKFRGNGNIKTEIFKSLSKGKVVAIDYKDFIWSQTKGGNHSSTIVASRINGNKCQVLVRGTYGPTCSGVNKGFECSSKDPGNVWVDLDTIEDSIRSITHF